MNRINLQRLGLYALLGATLMACTQAPKWTLFVSKGGESTALSLPQVAGYYDTLDQCQLKARGLMRLTSPLAEGNDSLETSLEPSKIYRCANECTVDESNQIHCQQLILVN